MNRPHPDPHIEMGRVLAFARASLDQPALAARPAAPPRPDMDTRVDAAPDPRLLIWAAAGDTSDLAPDLAADLAPMARLYGQMHRRAEPPRLSRLSWLMIALSAMLAAALAGHLTASAIERAAADAVQAQYQTQNMGGW